MFAPLFLSLCADAYDAVPALSLVTSGPECGASTRNRKQEDGHAHVDASEVMVLRAELNLKPRDSDAANRWFRTLNVTFLFL